MHVHNWNFTYKLMYLLKWGWYLSYFRYMYNLHCTCMYRYMQSQTECRLYTVFIYSGWFIPTFVLVLEFFLSRAIIFKKKLYWSNEHIMYMLKLRHRTWISQVRNEPPIHVIGEKYDHGLCIYIEYLSNIWKFHRKKYLSPCWILAALLRVLTCLGNVSWICFSYWPGIKTHPTVRTDRNINPPFKTKTL